ncbi:acyltransferase family protein [Pantoea agglomerans]
MSIGEKSAERKFPAADGIRGIAVLIVLIVHATVMFFPKTYPDLDGSGRIGVWLFFVLSSFLLANTFINRGFSAKNLISYFLGRILRIMPLYLITVGIYAAAGYLSKDEVWGLLKLNYPWGHLWTIAVEFKFYFILPLIVWAINKSYRFYGLTGATLISLVIIITHQYFYPYYTIKASSTNVIGYISTFTLGIYTAYLVQYATWKNEKAKLILSLIALTGIIISIPGMRYLIFGIQKNTYLWDKQVYFGFGWCIIIYCTLTSKNKLTKLLNNFQLRNLGHWSFSIYLIHWLIYTQLSAISTENYFVMLTAFFLAILAGGLLYNFIEKPFERARHTLMHVINRNY